ncbi:S53 family peptidase [Actinoallomurus rhizosphaericola]|uniref:S53 family peptidase n=1 Tax=Actinoallomurus rhizosphaericola TaxID=2952536 RepID=UPI002093E354|nr:S53 family peptidase [Actinoallomurus rhizosphaericola]MCO5995804.1 S53 family peptidase [Actinoallomurus rhizosphaericola]
MRAGSAGALILTALLTPVSAPVSAAADLVSMRAYLAGRDPAGLAALAYDVSNPRSPRYRRFLTVQEFRDRFAATPAQTASAESWLRSFDVKVTGATDHYVTLDATRDQATVLVRQTRLPPGVIGVVPYGDITAPARKQRSAADGRNAPRLAGDTTAPCSRYYGEVVVKHLPAAYGRTSFPATGCGYKPAQLRRAYGVTRSGMTGKGVTIGIVGINADPDLERSADHYAGQVGDAPFRPGQFSQEPATAPGGECRDSWGAERALDVEMAHGMAPDANVVYSSGGCVTDDTDMGVVIPDLLDGLDRIVDRRAADVVSLSWGTEEYTVAPAMIAAWEHTLQQAAVEGIGVYVAAGDAGDNSSGPNGRPSTNFPASSPWVTAVGGTTLEVDKNGDYEFETSWGSMTTDATADGKGWSTRPPGEKDSGGGGGVSGLFPQPDYQRTVVPDTLAQGHGAPMRVVPDVSAEADFYGGAWIGELLPNGQSAGGTSMSAPLFAAVQADAQQAAGGPIGFANPMLYSLDGSPLLHDVTDHPLDPRPIARVWAQTDASHNAVPGTATLITDGRDGDLSAGPGYDDATGLGSPAGGYLEAFVRRKTTG